MARHLYRSREGAEDVPSATDYSAKPCVRYVSKVTDRPPGKEKVEYAHQSANKTRSFWGRGDDAPRH